MRGQIIQSQVVQSFFKGMDTISAAIMDLLPNFYPVSWTQLITVEELRLNAVKNEKVCHMWINHDWSTPHINKSAI